MDFNPNKVFQKAIKVGLTILISVLVIFTIAKAGSLTPSASPAATSYTLSDIYTRLTTNATSTAGNHIFSPGASATGTLYTLTQLYNAIPTILSAKVLIGTSYLGIVGAAYGDTDASKVLTTATASGTYNAANISTSTVKLAITFGVNQTGALYGDTNAAHVLGTASASGTALVNLFNGTGQGFTGGSQANGGVDDYNSATTSPSDRYSKGWIACSAGNSYCGTSDTGADAKDDSTGLIWSMPCNGSGCSSFSDASPITYSWDNSAVNNASSTASQLCSNHAGWSLPHQKQLMQAYIDGSYGNLEASGVNRDYWSATTRSDGTTGAWYIYLSGGGTYINAKTGGADYVRCVRSAP